MSAGDNFDSLHKNGLILLEDSRVDEGVSLLEEAKAATPENLDLLNDLAGAYCLRGDLDRALVLFDDIINRASIEESSRRALFNKGTVLMELDRYDEALTCFDGAGEDDEALIGKSLSLLGLHKPEAALETVERVLSRDAEQEQGWFAKGSVLYQLGDVMRAQECWEQAVRINPDLSEAVINLNFLQHESE